MNISTHEPPWGNTLIGAVSSRKLPVELAPSVDDILRWLVLFDSRVDPLARRFVDFSGSEREAKILLLKLIDQWLLGSRVKPQRVFGSEVIRQKDEAAIRLRYKRLIGLFHPDRAFAEEAWLTERITQINDAYAQAKNLCRSNTEISDRRLTERGSSVTTSHKKMMAKNIYTESDQEWDKFLSNWYPKILSGLERLTVKSTMVFVGVALLLIGAGNMLDSSRTTSSVKGFSSVGSAEQGPDIGVNADKDVNEMLDELLAQTSTRATSDGFGLDASESNVQLEEIVAEYEATKLPEALPATALNIGSSKERSKPKTEALKEAVNLPIKRLKNNENQPNSLALEESIVLGGVSNEINTRIVTEPSRAGEVPSDVLALLDSLKTSFKASSPSKFVDHFAAGASYFGEQGRLSIFESRNVFFSTVEDPVLAYELASYEAVNETHLLHGRQVINFSAASQVVRICQSFSMVIKKIDGGLSIFKVEKHGDSGSKC